jgi:predicted nucleotidyltransferase
MKLFEVVPNLKNYIVENCIALPDALQRILIFGSFARGEARVGSDVDIALVAQNEWDFRDRHTARHYLENFDPHLTISPFYTTVEKLNTTDDKFDANYWIAREGVLLWER